MAGINNSLGFVFCNENATTQNANGTALRFRRSTSSRASPNPTQQFQYSPMLDTHLAEWTEESLNEGLRALDRASTAALFAFAGD
jgi:hypothetical protein